jgi:hypothetical protein
MNGYREYELSTEEQAHYENLLMELKELEMHATAANYARAILKNIGRDADFLTIDGVRVAQIQRKTPERFNANDLKAYDPHLYQRFLKRADAPEVSLHLLGRR